MSPQMMCWDKVAIEKSHSFYPVTLREMVEKDELAKDAFTKVDASKGGAFTGSVYGP